MKRPRKRNQGTWHNRWGDEVEYTIHPGVILARHMQWARSPDGFASMSGPEPDTINVAVLAPYTVTLELEHEYYARVDEGPLWISFGWSSDPAATIAQVRVPIVASWQCATAQAPREIKYPHMPDFIMAKDLPAVDRWRHNDIGDY